MASLTSTRHHRTQVPHPEALNSSAPKWTSVSLSRNGTSSRDGGRYFGPAPASTRRPPHQSCSSVQGPSLGTASFRQTPLSQTKIFPVCWAPCAPWPSSRSPHACFARNSYSYARSATNQLAHSRRGPRESGDVRVYNQVLMRLDGRLYRPCDSRRHP